MTISRHVATLVLLTVVGTAAQQAPSLSPDDILKLPATPAIARLAYGSDPLQFGELRVPPGRGPFPVAVVIHGGCYQKRFADLHIMDALSTALTAEGLATWNIEYRKIDEPGGAWPGMFQDIAACRDHVGERAPKYRVAPARVLGCGPSAVRSLA